jgi:hypothetical protein
LEAILTLFLQKFFVLFTLCAVISDCLFFPCAIMTEHTKLPSLLYKFQSIEPFSNVQPAHSMYLSNIFVGSGLYGISMSFPLTIDYLVQKFNA